MEATTGRVNIILEGILVPQNKLLFVRSETGGLVGFGLLFTRCSCPLFDGTELPVSFKLQNFGVTTAVDCGDTV